MDTVLELGRGHEQDLQKGEQRRDLEAEDFGQFFNLYTLDNAEGNMGGIL